MRIPHADNSLHPLPKDMDRAAAVMLSDILPTGHEIGALNGEVGLGDTVAIVGARPIGLAALMTSRFYSPARIIIIDPDENRLAMAKQLGATDTIARDPLEAIDKLTGGEGVDVAMEAVGIPETFDICQRNATDAPQHDPDCCDNACTCLHCLCKRHVSLGTLAARQKTLNTEHLK